jgi:hypothetical protein
MAINSAWLSLGSDLDRRVDVTGFTETAKVGR